MKSNHKVFLISALSAVLGLQPSAGAGVNPIVDSVSHSIDASGRTLTVNYALSGGDAIVTADILTNGVSIGSANLTHFIGDVNRKVAVGSRSASWRADRGWTGNLGQDVSVELTVWPLDNPPDYLAVDLSVPSNNFYYVNAESVPHGVTNVLYKTEVLLMRRIPAANARFRMGATASESTMFSGGRETTETAHQVTLTNDYYIGVYELTQRQLARFGDAEALVRNCDPYGDSYPVNKYKYQDLRGSTKIWPDDGHELDDGCGLDQLRRHSGLMFDLPTDAQWEFAARAGTGFMLPTGKDILDKNNADANLIETAWCSGNADGGTHIVGMKEPNAWGLYDVVGNVWEFCLDKPYSSAAMSADEVVEPAGSENRNNNNRVRRGGSFSEGYKYCRLSCRHYSGIGQSDANNGFRLWCPVAQQ